MRWPSYPRFCGSDRSSECLAATLRNEALIKPNVRTFDEGVRTTPADTRAPCERTP
jgi:hypothetical protein